MIFQKHRFRHLSIALVSLLALSQTSQAAVTITISGQANATNATVSLDGSLALFDMIGNGDALVVAVNSSTGSFGVLGSTPEFGRPTTSPFSSGQIDASMEIGSLPDTATATISDTSNGGAIISSSPIHNLTYAQTAFFNLRLPVSLSYPISIDAGDILTLSGSFDLDFGTDTFSSRFNLGTHTGSYNGQDVTVVVNNVPEPSSCLLAFLSGLILLTRRRA